MCTNPKAWKRFMMPALKAVKICFICKVCFRFYVWSHFGLSTYCVHQVTLIMLFYDILYTFSICHIWKCRLHVTLTTLISAYETWSLWQAEPPHKWVIPYMGSDWHATFQLLSLAISCQGICLVCDWSFVKIGLSTVGQWPKSIGVDT